MSALGFLAAWLALNYAVAAALVWRAARRAGAPRRTARRLALSWPLTMLGAAPQRRRHGAGALRARSA
jgi:hypothetical protein